MDFDTIGSSGGGGGGITVETNYPEVANYASLPAATSTTGIYIVLASSGVWPVRKYAGFYKSNGVVWTWLGNFTWVAGELAFTPTGRITSVDIAAAILEVSGFAPPAGGTTGQVLSKVNATDYNYAWATPASASAPAINGIASLVTGEGQTTAIAPFTSVTLIGVADQLDFLPFCPDRTVTIDQFYISVTTLLAGANVKVGVYSANADLSPNALLLASPDLSAAATGTKTFTPGTPFVFTAGTFYWIALHHSATPTIRAIPIANTAPIAAGAGLSNVMNIRRASVSYASGLPAVAPATALVSSIAPATYMRNA